MSFFFFLFFCSVFGFGLCCCVGLEEWEGMGWKSGRDGWGWKVKLYTIGKTVFFVAIWRKRERSNSKQIKTHKKNT